MKTALQRVQQALRETGTATRPALAAATGLSEVSVNKALSSLCHAGIAEETGLADSGGGRPARLYRYRTESAQVAYFQLREESGRLHGELEFMDLSGKRLRSVGAGFAYLEAQILDPWLDKASVQRPLAAIALTDHPAVHDALVSHLRERYSCPVRRLRLSDALADERDNSATLTLLPGEAPQCSMRRNGVLTPCGNLDLLPLPARWESLDYSDHTLVEEMVARLLLILTCTLAPRRFTLHAPFWTTKLVNRIRYNTNAKLGGKAPTLHFRLVSQENTESLLRQYATRGV